MNLFLNDALGPATKRYVGNIDLLRNQKSKLQAEADHMRETEDRFQTNLRLSYEAVIRKNGLRKDPDTGNWITADGLVMRLEDADGDGLYDAKDFFLGESDRIINAVEDELRGRLGEDEIIDQNLWNVEEQKKRIHRMVVMDWKHGENSTDIQRAIMDFKQGNKMTAAFIIYQIRKESMDDTNKYNSLMKTFREENIISDPQVMYMMKQFARADD